MAAVADKISPAKREALAALAAYLHEQEINRLVRERGQQRPPDPVPPLQVLADSGRAT